ncbi:MAG: tetratricopeptide repeat protein [Candidatus Acidiferrales bacterium]
MKLCMKLLACCALCWFIGASQGAAQIVGSAKTSVTADPGEATLNDLLAAAQAAMDRKDYQAAAQNYQAYLAKKPDDATAHLQLGYADMSLHNLGDAKTEYEKAISLDPKLGPAYLNLGVILVDTDPGAAVVPLQKAVELIPTQSGPKFLLGLALERTGKLSIAIEQYQAAKNIDDKDFNIRFSLGRALLSAGRAREAEPEFRAALALRPDFAAADLGLARSLIGEGNLDAGAAEMAAYLEKQPNDADARVVRASALAQLSKDDDALAELDRAAAAGPENLRALKLRSQIYLSKKRFDDAIPALQKAAALAPREADIPALLGHAYLEKKDYPDAVRELIAAFKMDPNANDVLGDLVAAQYSNGNYPAALDGLDLLSKRESLPPVSWFVRASCYDKLGQSANALEAYRQFLQLNKDPASDMYFEATARVRTLARELKKR